jgi:sugar phosphate isomerase/epimerase
MKLDQQAPLHLTYCLNIHPGEALAENRAAIRQHAVAVKRRLAPQRPFGLGLRLGAAAAAELGAPAARQQLRTELDSLGLYAFTINGFPYGQFHGARVKENVYAPDWRTRERLDYTCMLADILAELVPDGMSGSISTLPGSFKAWIHKDADVRGMAKHLVACAKYLAALREKTGCEIHVGLEPEPFCFLETTDEVIRFFEGPLAAACADAVERELVRRHLGVCLDTCHAALQFESPLAALRRYRAAGIRVSKIQLSAALETAATSAGALQPFDEPVYLHQTKARFKNGQLLAWPDLSDALPAIAQSEGLDTVRVHFHVPLFWEGGAPLRSTAADLNAEFFREACAATEHLEVETYTFAVLPEAMRAGGVVECICRELEWVRRKMPL